MFEVNLSHAGFKKNFFFRVRKCFGECLIDRALFHHTCQYGKRPPSKKANPFIKRDMNYKIHPIRNRGRLLRQNATPAETLLWQHLRSRQVEGAKFRRQHPLATGILKAEHGLYYYADFYCPECKLVVELDGSVHDQQEDYDRARDIRMLEAKYNVMRIGNAELDEIEAVIGRIAEMIRHIRSELYKRQKAARKGGGMRRG